MRHVSQQQVIIKYIYKKYFKLHIQPKIYPSLDKSSYNESSLYNIYIVPDVYYCNKYEIIVDTHIIQM